MLANRNDSIDIAKGFAIILVVLGHAGMPGVLNRSIYLFHMPLFFITAGYFFSPSVVQDPWSFIVKRFKGLYLPFVKWSIFLLLIHNLLFDVGILNEVYGNWAGGVTHPYTTHQFCQRFISIVFSMAGYDEFLGGAFWFFRGLLVASIAFLIAYILIDKITFLRQRPVLIAVAVCLSALMLGVWRQAEGWSIKTLTQGGYRDIMGTFFFGIGFLYRQYENRIGHSLWLSLLGFGIVLGAAFLGCGGMNISPRVRDVFSLALTGFAGWIMTYNISYYLNKRWHKSWLWSARLGQLSLYIFIWHVSAFKAVSLIKIWWYGLDIRQIGCHMVIHEHAAEDIFWLFYTVAGVCLPVIGYYLWKYIKIKTVHRM